MAQVSHLTEVVEKLNTDLVQQKADNTALQEQCDELRRQLRTVENKGPKRSRSADGRGPITPDRSALAEVDMTASPEERRGGPARRLEAAATYDDY